MRDSPRSAASAANGASLAEAERQLAGALQGGLCADPFGSLGPHQDTQSGHLRLRVYVPGSHGVTVLARETREPLTRLQAVDDSGLFTGNVTLQHSGHYLLQVDSPLGQRVIEDPYRFGPWLGDTDVWLLGEGRHLRPWEKLGAHPCTIDSVAGVAFAVWAPNARQVALAGDFNLWNSRCHPMRLRRECGVWEIFVPELRWGALYKFDVLGADGQRQLKTDPYALRSELHPGHASLVMALPEPVTGRAAVRQQANALSAPISIPGIFYLIDDKGRLLKWNKNFEPETGYTAVEIANMKALDFFTAEDRSVIAGKLQEAFDKGESTTEANLRSKTGQFTPYYFTAKKIFLEGEALLLGTALNISEGRAMQQKLVASEARLKEAQQLAQIGNWELDLHTSELKWSDEIYRIFDLDPKVFGATYEAFLNAIHPDDRQYVAQSYETSVATHTSYSIDHRLQMKDGSIKFVHEQCVTFYDEDGHAVRSIGTVQDITERKLIEEQQKSVSIYTRSLIEASLDPLVTISPEGKITDVNQATIKVTGIERSKLIGTDFSDYFTEPCKAKSGYQRVLEEGFVTDYPLTIRNINGKLIEVLYNASVYEDVSGKIVGVFAAARDVTAQKKAEEQLLKLNTTLEEKVKERTSQYETVNKELEAFTYSVSHDLRSPLRAVNSYSQILGEDYSERLDEDGRLILENIKYNTIKMGKLIDELLAFSRLGRKQLERTEIDMNVLVNEVLDEFNKSVEHHAEIKPGQLPIVKADQTLMHQVMLNLISNAVKYSSKKEKPVIEIFTVQKKNKDEKNVFVVKDNGVGFDMRFADKLFGVFQRLHSEKEFEGNGVGLAIVKRIINKHGGEVWGIGEENKGANFYFTLD